MTGNSILGQISECVVKAESEELVRELTQKAVTEGYAAKDIIDQGLLAGLDTIGGMWTRGDAFIPEVLLSAKIMSAGMEVIRELIVKSGVKPVGKVVIGTVRGDVHDIGKSLVAMLLGSAGFEVTDLGVDVAPERFVQVIKAEKPDLLGMSALLTTTMPGIADTIKAIQKEGLEVVTIIGGAPVTQEYADRIGANGYAPDAVSAVAKAKELLKIKR
ncbi:MAG: corrinoid protein [Dehalococcoidia bacterium]|nr:corrinoid protein [Dehalococcoidia bacterium]